MVFRILADLLLVFHLLFILFVLFGGIFVFYRLQMVLLHLPAVCWGIYIELSGNICPLTPLENHLRRMSGEAGYTSGFVDHFLMPILYPAGLTEEIQLLLAVCVLAVNMFAYFFVVRRYWRQRIAGRAEE